MIDKNNQLPSTAEQIFEIYHIFANYPVRPGDVLSTKAAAELAEKGIIRKDSTGCWIPGTLNGRVHHTAVKSVIAESSEEEDEYWYIAYLHVFVGPGSLVSNEHPFVWQKANPTSLLLNYIKISKWEYNLWQDDAYKAPFIDR